MGILEDIGGFLNQFKAPAKNSDDDWGRGTPSGSTSASGGSNHSFSGGGMNEQGESHYEGTGANQEGGNIWYPNDPFAPDQPPEQAQKEEPLWNVTPTNTYGVQNEPQTKQNAPQYKSGWDQIREATDKLLQPNDQQEELEPIVGDGGFLVDPYAEQEQPKPRESQTPEQPEDYWVNDLGQLQGAENQLNQGIDPNSTLGRRGNDDFDWSGYFGEEVKPDTSGAYVGENGYLFGDTSSGYGPGESEGKSGADVVDNGTNTYENRTSAYITVEEARRQAEAQGNQEMLDYLTDFKPADIMHKTELEASFGYKSYVPDDQTKFRRVANDIADAYTQGTAGIGRFRDELSKRLGTVDINGQQMSVKEVDDSIANEIKRLNREADKYDGNLMESPEAIITIKSTGQELDNAHIMGIQTDPSSGFVYVQMDDGSLVPTNTQNTAAGLNLSDLFDARWKPIDIGGQKVDVKNIANYTKDPTLIQGLTKFNNLEEKEKAVEESGANVNYGIGGFNVGGLFSPSYANKGMVDYNNNGGIEKLNVADPSWWLTSGLGSLTDMGLQSLPWFFAPTQLANMAAGTELSAAGVDPMAFNANGTYTPVGDVATAPAAYLASAIGESTLGSIGAGGRGVFETIGSKIAPNAMRNPVVNHFVTPAITEGLEEVTMNPFWEYAAQGPKGWYADDSYDENGYYTGQNENTPMSKRISNMVSQAPEGFLGGALMGGPIGAVGGVRAKMNGTWADEVMNHKLGWSEDEDTVREVFSPDVARIINHEIERNQ